MDLGRFETNLNVADVQRSLDFYRLLGFKVVDGDVAIRTVTMRCGDCTLALYQGYLDPPQLQLGFSQGDVEAITKDLLSKGVEFIKGPAKDENGAGAMLVDPDGHPIHLINLPISFYNQPGFERPSAPYEPKGRAAPDPVLGHYELSLVTQDVARGLAFYRKLGFEVLETNDAGMSVTLQNGDCRIALYQDVLDPSETQLIFFDGDVERVIREFSAKGITFGRIIRNERGVGAHLRDPDGHAIYFNCEPGQPA